MPIGAQRLVNQVELGRSRTHARNIANGRAPRNEHMRETNQTAYQYLVNCDWLRWWWGGVCVRGAWPGELTNPCWDISQVTLARDQYRVGQFFTCAMPI